MTSTNVEEMDNEATELRALAGLRVVVTGGTSGLGLALVRALRASGAEVAFVARTRERVIAVAEETGAIGIVADVADKDDIHRIALQVGASVGASGAIDLLVNNASSLGPVPLRPLGDTDCEDLEAALAANLLGPFRLTKALLGPLAAAARESAPSVVLNVSSDAATSAYAEWGAYGASKAALAHLSAIWSLELAGERVRVLSLDPGDMDTPLHELALPGSDRASLKRPVDAARALLRAVIAARGEVRS
ncbi:MAG: SDR family oxidoreductase [Sandaracinaceae bacterium]|nr:SDR family oxidoreductase [Sandaracinaceae bacterium]